MAKWRATRSTRSTLFTIFFPIPFPSTPFLVRAKLSFINLLSVLLPKELFNNFSLFPKYNIFRGEKIRPLPSRKIRANPLSRHKSKIYNLRPESGRSERERGKKETTVFSRITETFRPVFFPTLSLRGNFYRFLPSFPSFPFFQGRRKKKENDEANVSRYT